MAGRLRQQYHWLQPQNTATVAVAAAAACADRNTTQHLKAVCQESLPAAYEDVLRRAHCIHQATTACSVQLVQAMNPMLETTALHVPSAVKSSIRLCLSCHGVAWALAGTLFLQWGALPTSACGWHYNLRQRAERQKSLRHPC